MNAHHTLVAFGGYCDHIRQTGSGEEGSITMNIRQYTNIITHRSQTRTSRDRGGLIISCVCIAWGNTALLLCDGRCHKVHRIIKNRTMVLEIRREESIRFKDRMAPQTLWCLVAILTYFIRTRCHCMSGRLKAFHQNELRAIGSSQTINAGEKTECWRASFITINPPNYVIITQT